MPSPSDSQTLYTQQAAMDEFWEFSYDRFQFIATQVFPVLESAVAAGPFGVMEIEEMLKAEQVAERAPGTAYSEDRAQFANDSFRTRDFGRVEVVDDNERETWAAFMSDPDSFATQRAVNFLMRQRELRVANQLFDTTTFNPGNGNGVTPTVNWDVWATATPVADVESAAQLHFTNSGMWPNALVMSRRVFRQLRNCAEVIARISASGAGDRVRATDVTAQQMAEVFDVDRVLVAGGAQNTAPVGATKAISQLWGDHAMLCTVAMTSDPHEPCIGRTIHWSADGSTPDGTVERWHDDDIRSDKIRVRHQTDEKLLLADVGVLIDNVL